ncbi:hypothetical protein J3R82DRAFT_8231 [Butyriboletus roseoflavus]|nr:hypothetical protein J3R82DRAFT_8231 [Butyriboletus roseoflavus]
MQWPTYAGVISTSTIDLTIAAAISYLLHRNRGGFAQTDRMINKITLYVISTGMITSTITVSGMIAYLLAPTEFYFLMIDFSSSKAYTNTLLATLNSRQYISASTPTTVGTILQFNAATPSTVADGAMGAKGGSGSQNVIASLARNAPDMKESADSLTGQSSDRMAFPTNKVSDPTWVRVVAWAIIQGKGSLLVSWVNYRFDTV